MILYLHLPVELILYISRILRNHQLFKIREKLDMDMVFQRHIILVKYISKSKFYREREPILPFSLSHEAVWKQPNTTVIYFKQDPVPNRSQIISTTIDLKIFRKTMAELKGKVMLYV